MADLQEAFVLNPPVVSPDVTPKPLFPQDTVKKAFWISVFVRDMGTATYVRVGDNININDSFLGAGDFRIYGVPDGYYFDAAKFYCISDTNDSIIEVQGSGPGF